MHACQNKYHLLNTMYLPTFSFSAVSLNALFNVRRLPSGSPRAAVRSALRQGSSICFRSCSAPTRGGAPRQARQCPSTPGCERGLASFAGLRGPEPRTLRKCGPTSHTTPAHRLNSSFPWCRLLKGKASADLSGRGNLTDTPSVLTWVKESGEGRRKTTGRNVSLECSLRQYRIIA